MGGGGGLAILGLKNEGGFKFAGFKGPFVFWVLNFPVGFGFRRRKSPLLAIFKVSQKTDSYKELFNFAKDLIFDPNFWVDVDYLCSISDYSYKIPVGFIVKW